MVDRTDVTSGLDVVVMGAGIAGCIAAMRLQQNGCTVKVVEAQSQPGGRLASVRADTPWGDIEVSPAWFWESHTRIKALLAELNLSYYSQFDRGVMLSDRDPLRIPDPMRPQRGLQETYRITGGVRALVDAISAGLEPDTLLLNHPISVVTLEGDEVVVTTSSAELRARYLIITVPPWQASQVLTFNPPLPPPVQTAIAPTRPRSTRPTNVLVLYEEPFWRGMGSNGTVVSTVGPIWELYDATPADKAYGALFGWLDEESFSAEMDFDTRREAVHTQLLRIFGARAADPQRYFELEWGQLAPMRAQAYEREGKKPSGLCGEPLLQTASWHGRLHWASSEISAEACGYLEGALLSAERAVAAISRTLQSDPLS